MRTLRRVVIGGAAALTLLAVVTPVAQAAGTRTGSFAVSDVVTPTPGVYPPNAKVQGETYAQLSAKNWEWIFDTSMRGPRRQVAQAVAPLTGPVNCRYGQSGSIWFLQPPIGSSTSTVNRSCTVPKGTVIFFPVYSAWQDNLNTPGQPPTTYTARKLRTLAAGYLANASSLSVSVDGQTVADLTNLSSPYRAKSPLFDYTLPADSFYNAYFGLTWPAGTTTPPPGAVADGVYVALKPLATGTHTIQWDVSGTNLATNVTYTITVP